MAKRTAMNGAKPKAKASAPPPTPAAPTATLPTKGKETTRADRVRAEWAKFELWHKARRAERDAEQALMLQALEDEMKKRLKSVPKGLHPTIVNELQEQFALAQSGEEEEFFAAACVEWNERLLRAGLQAEDWTNITLSEMRTVNAALGGNMDEEDLLAAIPATNAADTSQSIPIKSKTNGDRRHPFGESPVTTRFMSATSSTKVSAANGRDDKTGRSTTRSATAFPSGASEDEHTRPPLLSHSSHPVHQRWAKDASAASRPAAASRASETTTSRTQSPPRRSRADSTASHYAGPARHAEAHYIGPVLVDADTSNKSEEEEFEAFKMATREAKIREFHELAMVREVALSRKLADRTLESDVVKQLIAQHERSMVELRLAKEDERKLVVAAERERRRGRILAQAEPPKTAPVRTARDVPRHATPALVDRAAAETPKTTAWKKASPPPLKSTTSSMTTQTTSSSRSTATSSSGDEAMRIDQAYEMWRPSVSPDHLTRSSATPEANQRLRKGSVSAAPVAAKVEHAPAEKVPLSHPRPQPAAVTELQTQAQSYVPSPSPALSNKSSSKKNATIKARKKGRKVTVEEVFDDDSSAPPPKATLGEGQPILAHVSELEPTETVPARRSPALERASAPASHAKAIPTMSSTRKSSFASAAAASADPVSRSPAASRSPTTPEPSSSWFASQLTDDSRAYYDVTPDSGLATDYGTTSTDESSVDRHTRWQPSAFVDSDTESVEGDGGAAAMFATAFEGRSSPAFAAAARTDTAGWVDSMSRVFESGSGSGRDKTKRKRPVMSSGDDKRPGAKSRPAVVQPEDDDGEADLLRQLDEYKAALSNALNG